MRMRSSLLAGAALSIVSATGASAQTIYKHFDANGVDMVNGTFNFELLEGSIGAGEGQIALVHRFSGGLPNDNLTLRFRRTVSGSIATIDLVFGLQRLTFTGPATGTSFTSQQGNGGVVTKISSEEYRYTDNKGNVTTYQAPGLTDATNRAYCSFAAEAICGLIATKTITPTGHTTTYEWEAQENCRLTGGETYTCAQFWRQRGLSNNAGYRVQFTFQQEAKPASGLPSTPWYTIASAKFYNDRVTSAPRTVSFSFPSNYITDVTTDGGETWRFTRDTALRLTGIRKPGEAADSITVSYNGANLDVTKVVADGITTNYARTVSGNESTIDITNALGETTRVIADIAAGRPLSVRDPASKTTSFLYDGYGRWTREAKPDGNYTLTTYDIRGNATQTRTVAKLGSGEADITTSATYPASCTNVVTCNKPVSTTDARGKVTNYEWDPAHGGLTSVTAPMALSGVRPQTRYSYSAASGATVLTGVSACQTLASCAGAADEVKTVIGYDVNRIASSTTTGAGNGTLTATVAQNFDAYGNLANVDGPMAGTADTTTYRYDAARRLVGTISADPDGAGALKRRAERRTFNAKGQLAKIENGTVTGVSDGEWAAFASAETVDIGYNANGLPDRQVLSAGGTAHAVTDTSYDAIGRPSCVAQRMNPAAWGVQVGACTPQAVGSAGPDRIAQTLYTNRGAVLSSTEGLGTAQQATVMSATYSNNGELETVTDGEGNKTSYEYDGHDRLRKTFYPSPTTDGVSSAGDYEQLGYDAGSNVVSRRMRDGQVIGYGYDDLGRLVSKDRPNGIFWETDHGYAYDNLGRMTSASDSNGHVLSFGYDALGRKVSESSNWYGTMTSAYDLAGNRIRQTWPDGFFIDRDYLATGEVAAIREYGAVSGVGVLATFGYDDLGRRVSLVRGNGSVTSYGYDAVSRLASLSEVLPGSPGWNVVRTFGYNPAGQLASGTRSNDGYAFGYANADRVDAHNGLNQLVSSAGTVIGHDARGNITSIGGVGYSYTAENQLVGGPVAALAYDPVGRMFYQSAPSVTFHYDGGELAWERDGATGALLRRYVHGPGVDEPLVWYEGAGTSDRRCLHADERGSITAVTNASGVALAINRYDEYGVPASGNIGRFQYTGQMWLPEFGMYHYKARAYHPGLGRFMQADPIGYGDGMNLYAYVGGDPVNAKDPTGLYDDDILVTARRLHADGNGNIWNQRLIGFDFGLGSSKFGEFDEEIVVTAVRSKRKKARIGKIVMPQDQQPNNDCLMRGSSGSCQLRPGNDGKPQLDPVYAKRACQAYKTMMQSNKEIAAGAGATNLPSLVNALTGGAFNLLGRVARFFGLPGFVFVRGATYVTTAALSFGSSPPPGCQQ